MKIIIFGKDTCYFCLKSKELLDENNIEYKYILMDEGTTITKLII